MLNLKSEINRILERHVGASNPIKAKDLAKLMSRDEREVRQVIREIIADGVPVLSRTDNPAGYFIAASFQEVEDYKKSLRSRLIEDALRLRDVRRGFTIYWNGNKQGRLV